MKKLLLVTALLLTSLVAYGAWYVWGPAIPPQGQEGVLELNAQNIAQLQTAFNEAADRPRIIALLSPT